MHWLLRFRRLSTPFATGPFHSYFPIISFSACWIRFLTKNVQSNCSACIMASNERRISYYYSRASRSALLRFPHWHNRKLDYQKAADDNERFINLLRNWNPKSARIWTFDSEYFEIVIEPGTKNICSAIKIIPSTRWHSISLFANSKQSGGDLAKNGLRNIHKGFFPTTENQNHVPRNR